jgi:putative endopeptidase
MYAPVGLCSVLSWTLSQESWCIFADFSAQNDPALNFAGSGVIIGHENSHGFDDQGREYDGNGMLKNWWLPQTLQQFEQRTSCMMKQYSSFEVLPGVYVNGNLTIGENIADNGGVKASYYAYLGATATPNPQLFFVAYAQGW